MSSNPYVSGPGSGPIDWYIGLSNTVHSEVAHQLNLPSLPVFCGAADPELRLFDEPSGGAVSSGKCLSRGEILSQSSRIADLLGQTNVSYLNLRDEAMPSSYKHVEPLELHDEVLRCNHEAFDLSGLVKEKTAGSAVPEREHVESLVPVSSQLERDHGLNHSFQPDNLHANGSNAFIIPKVKKKSKKDSSIVQEDPAELQDNIIKSFSEMVEDFCGRAESHDNDRDEVGWLSMPLDEIRVLVKDVTNIGTKKLLHMVPVDLLTRLLRVLDQQIHLAEGLSIDEYVRSDSDIVCSVLCALESIHASLAVMAHNHMPKQLYREEIIERILEFSRHQMMDVMSASDPSYRALHRPTENGGFAGEEDEEPDVEFGSASKKRRSKTGKVKRSASNKVSGAVNMILQKLCAILGLLKDLLLIEKLSDSCILQLLKTCFTTFLVENIQLLQLKAIGLIGGIFYSYKQHQIYVIDETSQLLWKLPASKRALRTYHLPDEEQRQIQMVTALLIQLVHSNTSLPDSLTQSSNCDSILKITMDICNPTKYHKAATDVCCLFWTPVLQRLTTVKSQDASELKTMIENLVADLLTTINLPEYPASTLLLEVLCVLLLNNAGLKSKDTSVRSTAIDLLGTIAARLKHDALISSKDIFWVLKESAGVNNDSDGYIPKEACSVCLSSRTGNMFTCQSCLRLFHADCMGVEEQELPNRNWYCQLCICKRQLLVLQSYCKSGYQHKGKLGRCPPGENSEGPVTITKSEIVQQMLLNHLQDTSSTDDAHLFIRWFYLCFWYKVDPKCEQNFMYYIARLKAKTLVRESGSTPPLLSRDSVKKISLALGQNNTFSRGFETILLLLLASLRDNSPIIRAKALRAVSIIVEADPEVLRDKRVQLAVEGRFCDSAISVREAALELVGRYIASHPDVSLQYFEKVAERIKDTGVSVRKKAIKIIRDMCTSNPNFSGFTSACIEIISRVSDEESSIQDLVCKTFYDFWFEESSGLQTKFSVNGSCVPLELTKKTEQMVELLRTMPTNQLLGTVIRRNLALDFFPQSTKAAGISPVALASVRRRCELMCQCLLEKILQVEEMSGENGEVRALPYVLVLHAFCVVDPGLCVPASNPTQFLSTLQSYLKTQVDNRLGAQLLESIIFIIDSVLPLVGKLPQNVSEELEQDLKHMIIRHSFLTVVHACIRCLCSVSDVSGKGATVVEYLLQLFTKWLDTRGDENKQLVGRSLFCLGLLVRYGNPLLSTSSSKSFNIVSCLDLLRKFLLSDDFSLKVRSLQALGFVLIARPEYMLEKDIGKILEAALSSDSDVHLKMQALQNIYEYLLDAESQMGADKASNHPVVNGTEGGHSVPVAAGAGDTNICGGVVQLFWDNILGRCLDLNDQVRQSALKIVEVAMRQGLVHPITCVPYLIAMETDPHEANQKLAHHLLMNMNEKYPAFFESRLGDGLQLSFIFMQSLSSCSDKLSQKSKFNIEGKLNSGSFSQARLGVARIYKLIRINRVSRNKFLSSIVRKFEYPVWNDSVIPFLMYCIEMLASIPFTAPDEPLYLIYIINRVLQVRAGVIEANIKALLQKDGAKIPRENGIVQQEPEQHVFNQINMMDLNGICSGEAASLRSITHMSSIDLNLETQLEPPDQSVSYHTRSGEAKMSNTQAAENCSISSNDMQKVQVEALAAISLQLLLRLKRHLKLTYNLDDARCQAFSPSEPLKPGDSFSRQTIPFDISGTRTDMPSSYRDLSERYQELKNALREDTIDYSTYSANIKRKRPTPRKGPKPKRMVDREDDEDDDDEDWGGGARKLNFSGSKLNTRSRRRS